MHAAVDGAGVSSWFEPARRVGERSGPAPRPRLLDQVRNALRLRHYSRRTERAYVGWVRRYVLFHGKRHPAEMGATEVSRFLSFLVVESKSTATTSAPSKSSSATAT